MCEFTKRSAVQGLATKTPGKVNCLTGFYYEEAMKKAADADAILKETGKPIGPLHGVPIAVKVLYSSTRTGQRVY